MPPLGLPLAPLAEVAVCRKRHGPTLVPLPAALAPAVVGVVSVVALRRWLWLLLLLLPPLPCWAPALVHFLRLRSLEICSIIASSLTPMARIMASAVVGIFVASPFCSPSVAGEGCLGYFKAFA